MSKRTDPATWRAAGMALPDDHGSLRKSLDRLDAILPRAEEAVRAALKQLEYAADEWDKLRKDLIRAYDRPNFRKAV